ncbi:PilZ domain-containing protein [Thermaerobacillus caldiproteolyticus]|uniref:PilZ domain-containing protein n=1 Tax=Thermaerobacillus caldiproteolyticus TaxID=247480 RepID=A0A7V9Z8A3_9BACL|nr:PilZ domain-containing protein [Anoxybacillus caldiproteolyticus]MBA2875819.1 hypothetical protein [Anoxybacillus caldiproteolyticus]
MRFRRQEAFRYEFGQPLPCTFRLVRIDGRSVESEEGRAHIHDISPRGMKIETWLHIQPEQQEIEIQVTFALNDIVFRFLGMLVWQKPLASHYYYGVRLMLSDVQEEMLVREIKQHAALRHGFRR